jgi:DNA polymerase-3 subunit beta
MTFSFHVDTQAINALELFAGKQDVRYYLNGIWACAQDARTVRLCASDGHTLAEHRITTETDMEGAFPRSGIIPRDAFKGLKQFVAVTIVPLSADMKTSGTYSINDGERAGKLIDATFPDLDRVWPKAVSLEAAHLDPDYVARIGKAAQLLAGKGKLHSSLYQNGDSPSMFKVRDDFAGLIMPMRQDAPSMPDWVASKITPDLAKESAHKLLEALTDLVACINAGVKPAQDDAVLADARAAILAADGDLRSTRAKSAA